MIPPIILTRDGNRDALIERVANVLRALSVTSAWRVEIKPHKATRSLAQNRTLWGVVYPAILQHLPGWDVADVHEYCLGECFGWETVEGFGRKRMKPIKRSAKLSVTEFMDYIAWIQRTMAERGIFVPDPEGSGI